MRRNAVDAEKGTLSAGPTTGPRSDPPAGRPAGRPAEIPRCLAEFVLLFNAGEFWESHEVLEGPWRASRSPFYHGLILLASAWVHVQRMNPHGVRAQLEKARRAFEPRRHDLASGAPRGYLGLDLPDLLGRCDAWLDAARRVRDPSVFQGWPRPELLLDRTAVRGDEFELDAPDDDREGGKNG